MTSLEPAADERSGACGADADAPVPPPELTRRVIGCFFQVYDELGLGFLESVYEAALATVLQEQGIDVRRQVALPVDFHGRRIGEFRIDLLVEGCLLVELKACRALVAEHHAQLLNYLRASPVQVGLLLNFGPTPQFRRLAFSNRRKRVCVGPRSGPLRSSAAHRA